MASQVQVIYICAAQQFTRFHASRVPSAIAGLLVINKQSNVNLMSQKFLSKDAHQTSNAALSFCAIAAAVAAAEVRRVRR